MRAIGDCRLYLVAPGRPDLADLIEAAVRGGVDVVQVRERSLDDRELLGVLEGARETTRRLGVPLVVNDRADLALLVGADYLHVGQDDLPVAAGRRLGLHVGLSTHAPGEIDAADADYIGVGPVYGTPTKPGRPAVGLALVRHAAARARQPWFAIGGIHAGNVGEVVRAGAERVAVVRAIVDADDPERAAAELSAALGQRVR